MVEIKSKTFSKTKIAGYLILGASVLKILADVFDGGGFDLASNYNELIIGLSGAGLSFLRDGIQKLQDALSKK